MKQYRKKKTCESNEIAVMKRVGVWGGGGGGGGGEEGSGENVLAAL